MSRVDPRKLPKKIPIESGRIRHSGVSQHEREDGSESCPHDQAGYHPRRPQTINPLHEHRDHIKTGVRLPAVNHVLPRHHGQDADVHQNI